MLLDMLASSGSKTFPAGRGRLVEYLMRDQGYAQSPEGLTHTAIARRLAAIKGFEFAGMFQPGRRHAPPLYYVPSDTIVGRNLADALGIQDAHDLFGAVVPRAFVATKVITHGLVGRDATAPDGWSPGFAGAVRGAVLTGFSCFSPKDAWLAGLWLLERGPVRLKLVHGVGGRGQTVLRDQHQLRQALDELDPAMLAADGVVLEENLTGVVTFSVGQVQVGELVASYYGWQRLTRDHQGEDVYGGSTLHLVRGGFDVLLHEQLPPAVRLAIRQACLYDEAAHAHFPGLFGSRRNYDVARGKDAAGRWRSGVLEQSWRIGGASGAEIEALEAFHRDPELKRLCASTYEFYGTHEPPPHATVYYDGIDGQSGRLIKYATVEPDDPR